MLDKVPAEVFALVIQHVYPDTFYSLILTCSSIHDKIQHPRAWKIVYTAYIHFKKYELNATDKRAARKLESYEKALKTIPVVRKELSFRGYLKQTIIEQYYRKKIPFCACSYEELFEKIENAANAFGETDNQRIRLRKRIGTYQYNVLNRFLESIKLEFNNQEDLKLKIEKIVSTYHARNNIPRLEDLFNPALIHAVVKQLAKNNIFVEWRSFV